MKEKGNHSIYLLLFYTATIWGLNVSIIKMLTEYFDVIHMSALRMAVAAFAIALIGWFKWREIPFVKATHFYWLCFIGFCMIYAHQVLLALGLQKSTATNGSLILALNPLFSVILSFLFFKEKITGFRIGGVGLGLFGVCLVVLNKNGAQIGSIGLGDFILFLSMIVYVLGVLGIRKVAAEVSPLIIAFYMHVIGSLLLFLHSAFLPPFYNLNAWFPSYYAWFLILVSGLASTAAGNLFWNMGISSIGVGRTSMFLNWLPVSGLIFAAMFLGETISFVHIIGLFCILFGVYLGVHKHTRSSSSISVKETGSH